jgi:HlyD family secretion protein
LPPIAGAQAHASPALWRWLRRLLFVAAAVGAVIALRLTYFRPAAVPVTVAHVETGRVEELITNNKAGTVSAHSRASLTPEIGGRIARIPVKEGDRVKRGDVVIELDDTDLRAQVALQERTLDTARAAAAEACTAGELAGRELERSRRLFDIGAVSRQTLEQAEHQHATADAACATGATRVEQARAAVDVARVNVDKTVLRAPLSGVVSKVSVQRGEWVTPAPPGLALPSAVDLIDTASIYVRAPLDEVDAGKVHPGLPVRISMDAFPGRTFAGHVTHVGAYVSEAQQQNRTFDIDAAFDDPAVASTLLPGTSADVEIILRTHDQVLRVPTSAVLQGGHVLVVRDEVLVSVPVRTGLANWEFTEVLDGLTAGDAVVVSLDRVEVKAGARVTLQPESR